MRGEMFLQGARDVALHHLHVVDVVLHEQIARAYVRNELKRLRGPVQEEAGNIDRVDRLDQKLDPLPGERIRGEAQIADQHLVEIDRVRAVRRDADEAVELTAIERLGVVDGARDAVAKLLDPVGQDGDAALARRPIAGGQIVQHLRQPVLVQLLAQLGLVEIIREQIFHPAEARSLGGGEAIEERLLAEQHGEIGGKFGHDLVLLDLCRQQLAGLRRARSGRRVVQRQIEHLLELDDVVDLGAHRDVGDAFENELDHDRHLEFRHPFPRGRERRLRMVRIGDADRLAAEAFGDRDVIDAIDRRARAR